MDSPGPSASEDQERAPLYSRGALREYRLAFTPLIRDAENAVSDFILGAPHASTAIRDTTDAIAAQARISHPSGPFKDEMNSQADTWSA
jgi:hypothetical protein